MRTTPGIRYRKLPALHSPKQLTLAHTSLRTVQCNAYCLRKIREREALYGPSFTKKGSNLNKPADDVNGAFSNLSVVNGASGAESLRMEPFVINKAHPIPKGRGAARDKVESECLSGQGRPVIVQDALNSRKRICFVPHGWLDPPGVVPPGDAGMQPGQVGGVWPVVCGVLWEHLGGAGGGDSRQGASAEE
eukprot:scaffold4477_cov417-Prasinococcus_capsulatus_cf.AAC.4